MLRFVILACLAFPAVAQEAVTDAFGIRSSDKSERDSWAGWTETVTASGAIGREVSSKVAKTVHLYLGEKSLMAGGTVGQVAALVLDSVGNLAPDGTKVTFTIGSQITMQVTQNGVAARDFHPGISAGQFHAGVAIEGQQSERAEYQVYPDLESLATTWRRDLAPVLAEDIYSLETTNMVDRFGNRVMDGMGSEAHIIHPSGAVTLVPMLTVAGIAQGQLLARDMPDSGIAEFTIGQEHIADRRIMISRPTVLAPVEIVATLDEATAATRLTIGPFLTNAGYALNDGSPVEVKITLQSGQITQLSSWVSKGVAMVVMLAGPTDFPMSVEVFSTLGVTRRVFAAPETGAP